MQPSIRPHGIDTWDARATLAPRRGLKIRQGIGAFSIPGKDTSEGGAVIVVSDTSPVNYLVLIGHADLIHRLFDRVVVPEAVVKELVHPCAPKTVREWIQSRPE